MRHQAFHLLVALSFVVGVGVLPFHSSAQGARATSSFAATALTPQSAGPLPGGCGHVTPPGEDRPVCCVSGLVYMDGQPIAGAEVRIQNQDGDQVTLVTQVYSDSLTPSYRLNLSAPPLEVTEGALITVTARYSGHERSLSYAVREGGQQVDVVLARPQREGYVFERQLWGQAAPRQFNFPNGVATDRHGNIYVADWKNARVQVLGSNGQFIRQWGMLGNLPGQFNLPTDVALDASGNVYVTDTGNHRIQKFSSVGQLIAVWGSYGRADNQFDDPVGVAVDGNGSVYVADSNNQRIQKFSGAGRWLATWDDLEGSSEGFQPQGVAANSAGFVYVVSYAGIRKLDRDGHVVAHLTHPQADEPSGISIDSGDNIYVSDFECHCILRFDSHDTLLPAWGSGGSGSGQFDGPTDVAVDRDGNVYIADFANHRIQKLDSSGNWKASWGDYGRANGQFGSPSGVAVDRHGNTYVADTENDRIQKFGPGGGHLATWTSARGIAGAFRMPRAIAIDKDQRLYVSDQGRLIQLTGDGDGIAAWLYEANGIALDNSGNIYLTQAFQVLKLTSTGDLIKTWGGFGTADGQFRGASGIGVDSDYVYVADGGNSRVQKFTGDGHFISAWGSSQYPQFQGPSGLAIDGAGKIYVAANSQLWKFQASGGFITRWGGAGVSAGEFGPFSPGGIDVGTNGGVYAADGINNRIQVFRPMSFTKPIATMNYLSATSLKAGDQLLGYGMGQDSDETPAIAAYRWTSNRNGPIGESAMLSPTVKLDDGLHEITFKVQDTEQEWSEPISTTVYVIGSTSAQWIMLLYLAGDYQDRGRLLNAFNRALSELRSVSHPPSVRIAVQLDGPGVSDTVRLLIMPGAPATVISYGEQAMDDPAALADFVRWGQSSFRATHYYLAIADHGQGIQGIAWDHASDPGGGAYLTVAELGAALKAPGVAPIDVLHLDACSMNLLEVAYEVHERVGILIASQYLAWDYFAYPAYQRLITATTTPDDLARGIVAHYAALARADRYPYTIAALNLERVPSARAAVDTLALHLIALIDNQQLSKATLNDIRLASQKFESNGDYTIDNNDMYVDLVDWIKRVRSGVDDSAVQQLAQELIEELTEPQRFVIASRAESNPLPPQYASGADILLDASHGMSIFYPQQYDTLAFDRYIKDQVFSFTSAASWPDFLIRVVEAPGCPGCELKPLPGPLPPLTDQRQAFLPIVAR
jgi:DNA-binding beta-propeller fold protein YncE